MFGRDFEVDRAVAWLAIECTAIAVHNRVGDDWRLPALALAVGSFLMVALLAACETLVLLGILVRR